MKVLKGLFSAAIGLFVLGGSAVAGIDRIELTPTDVMSSSSSVFSSLPTDDPGLFGLSGGDVRGVDFDFFLDSSPIASGTSLTDQFASLGVLMNGVTVSSGVFGGAASAPNATLFDQGHIFTFTVPVVAVGIINTSPDQDRIRFFSGPNGTGMLLDDFIDQDGLTKNFNIDRFVGGRATGGMLIGSFVITNEAGNLELDELIFEVGTVGTAVPLPAALPAGLALLGMLGMRRGRVGRRG